MAHFLFISLIISLSFHLRLDLYVSRSTSDQYVNIDLRTIVRTGGDQSDLMS